MPTRYVHTNIISEDWQALARFYQEVFDCRPVPPKRDLSGDWLTRGTAVPDATFQGMHLRLPGYGDNGPTLEIYQYSVFEPNKGIFAYPPKKVYFRITPSLRQLQLHWL